MILLTCAKMPDGLDNNTLASAVGMMFPNPENEEYLEAIRRRANDVSACESLFALALLYEQIFSLPCPPVDMSELVFARNEYGKPYFKSSEIKFNISHSHGYVACAASIGEELGVDIEASPMTAERAERMAKRYFCGREQQEIAKHPEVFARKWSEKEAKAKFFGESVGNILSIDKNSPNNTYFENLSLHKFSFENIPITLCTKRNFSTIIFAVL